jgi:hypothetical protein
LTFDDRALTPPRNRDRKGLASTLPAEVDLFLETQLPLNDDHFFEDGYDCYVTFRTHRRRRVYRPIDRHSGDRHDDLRNSDRDLFVESLSSYFYANSAFGHLPRADGQLFFYKCN